jgi:hypothetical protein
MVFQMLMQKVYTIQKLTKLNQMKMFGKENQSTTGNFMEKKNGKHGLDI